MRFHLDSKLPAALAMLVASLWTTQSNAQTSAVLPAKPVAPTAVADTAPLSYRSALKGYQPYTDEKTANWKEANDTTARIGGWRAYARQASQEQVPEGSGKLDSSAAPAKP